MPNSPNSELKKAEERQTDISRHRKEYSIEKYLIERIEAEKNRTGKTESDIANIAFLFYLEHKDSKMERNRFYRLEQLAEDMPCNKCGKTIPEGSTVPCHRLKGAMCLECNSKLGGSKALAEETVKILAAKATVLALDSEIKEKAEKLEALNNKEQAHELVVKCEETQKLLEDNAQKQASLFKQVSQLSDPELIEAQKQQREDAQKFHDKAESLNPMFTVLEATTEDRLIRFKRKKHTPEIEEPI
jgi:hypothetical protein